MIIAGIEVAPKAVVDYLDIELETLESYSWQSISNNLKKTIRATRSKSLANVTYFVYAFNDNGKYEKQGACNRFIIRLHNAESKVVIDKLLAPLNQQFCILSNKLIELELAMDYYKVDGTAWTLEEGAQVTIYLLDHFRFAYDTNNKRMTSNASPEPIDRSKKQLEQKIIEGKVNFGFNRKYIGKNGEYKIRFQNIYYHIYFKCKDKHKNGIYKQLPVDEYRLRFEVNKLYSCDISELDKSIVDAGRSIKLLIPKTKSNPYFEEAIKKFLSFRGQELKPHWDKGNKRIIGKNMKMDTIANSAMRDAVKQLSRKF